MGMSSLFLLLLDTIQIAGRFDLLKKNMLSFG